MEIRVIIADDHTIVREGLKTLLQKDFNIDVVGEAENGREAVRLAKSLKPDMILMDIGMPELNGIEATKQVVKEVAETKVIGLSMHSDKQFIRGMFNAGAHAYLLKDCAADELLDAIQQVHSGKKYLSEDITDLVIREFVFNNETIAERGLISSREIEVLQLLAEGKSTKDISEELFISTKTVESHRKNLMEKLQIFSLPELTKYAIRTGITTL